MSQAMLDTQDLVAPLRRLSKVPQAELGGVACFFVKNGAVVSSGINYNPTGESMEQLIDGHLVSRSEVIHAEIAAIRAAATNGVDLNGTILLITMSPCIKCAHEIVKTGISELDYLYEWWDKASIEILRKSGIKVKKLKEHQ